MIKTKIICKSSYIQYEHVVEGTTYIILFSAENCILQNMYFIFSPVIYTMCLGINMERSGGGSGTHCVHYIGKKDCTARFATGAI